MNFFFYMIKNAHSLSLSIVSPSSSLSFWLDIYLKFCRFDFMQVSVIPVLSERRFSTHLSNKYCKYRQYRRESCPNIGFTASGEVLNWMWANTKHVYLNKRANSLHIDSEPARTHARAAHRPRPTATVVSVRCSPSFMIQVI